MNTTSNNPSPTGNAKSKTAGTDNLTKLQAAAARGDLQEAAKWLAACVEAQEDRTQDVMASLRAAARTPPHPTQVERVRTSMRIAPGTTTYRPKKSPD